MNMKTILSLGAVGLIVAFSVASFLVGCEDTGTVALTVTGTNDTASMNGTTTGSVTEDGTLSASGTVTVTRAGSMRDHGFTNVTPHAPASRSLSKP